MVTGKLADGSLHDVTGQTQFKSSNSKVAAVSKLGVVTPVHDGEANIEINANGKKQKLHVTVKGSRTQSAAFVTEAHPLLSKLGCNTAQCHGAARGKGGLRLSLFGGDAEADFEALTKASGGRRINRADPRDSLLYLKATGDLGHPGAKAGAREADILLTWLNGGAPWSNQENAQIADLKLYPDERQFAKGQTQRLLVTAIFSDGQVRDVTADAGYHTSNPKIASVSAEGLVRAEDSGDAAIVVTYQRQSAVLRLVIPQPGPKPFPKFAANNRIDELVYHKLKAMGVPPSPLATDEAFLRRVYLDAIGILPTAEEARAFLANPDRAKGYTASEALIVAGQNGGRLTITAPAGALFEVLSPVITGMAAIGKDTVMRRAESAESLMQAFAFTHVLPTRQLFLAVIPGTAYTIASSIAEGKVLEVKPESDTPIAIKVRRKDGVKAGVTITAVRLANNTITTKSVFVAPEKDEAEIVLTVAKDAKVGLRQDMIVSGLMRANNQSIVRYARAIPVMVVAR